MHINLSPAGLYPSQLGTGPGFEPQWQHKHHIQNLKGEGEEESEAETKNIDFCHGPHPYT